MPSRKKRSSEPEQTRIVRCAKKLARRKAFSTEDIREGARGVIPGTLSATLAKMRDLGYVTRSRSRMGETTWRPLRPLQSDPLEEIVKAVNKYSSLLSVMYRFRLNGSNLRARQKGLLASEKTAMLLKMLEEEKERARSRQRTLTRVYGAVARLHQ